MVNFYFEDDGDRHICEVQLVHSQMYLLRKEMGAHKTYGQVRGAKEILEMLDLNPEEGVDAKVAHTLKSLVWAGAEVEPVLDSGMLQAELRILNNKVEGQEAQIQFLKDKNTQFEEKFGNQEADIRALKAMLEALV